MVGFNIVNEEDGEAQDFNGLTLFPDVKPSVYNPEYAKDKADRFSLVLGDASPGTDILQSSIVDGGQDKFQQILKTREDTKLLARRNEVIRSIAQSRDTTQPINLDDLGLVEGLSNNELYSQDLPTILEKKYADLYSNIAVTQEDSHVAREALEDETDDSMEVMERLQAPMQRAQIAQDIAENMKKRYDDTSWASWGADMAKSFIPLYTTIKNRERIETPTGSLLLGNNMEEQISQLYSLPPAQFRSTLEGIINDLAADNNVEAMTFAQAVQSYSKEDKAWGNMGTVLDTAGALEAGVSAVKGVSKAARLARGLTTAGKAITTPPTEVGTLAAASGLNKTAAIATVSKNILSGDFSGISTMKRIDEVADRLPSLFAPKQYMTGGSKYLSAEAQARLESTMVDGASDVLRILQEGNQIDRLEPSQVAAAAQEAYDKIVDLFPSNAHKVIDTNIIPASADKITNTAVMEVKFGRQDGQLFKYEATAKNYAAKYIGLKTDDYTIQQDHLGGYYISVKRPLADVGEFRNKPIETSLATPNTWNSKFARALRSPDYLLADQNVRARGQVTAGTEYLSKILDDVTSPFRGKGNDWYNEMDSMFRQARTQKRNFSSVGEFETEFYKKFKKAPAEDQYEAYFRYVQMGDLDYIVRDADKVKRMTAKGLENFDYRLSPKEGQGPEAMSSITGKVVDRLPLDEKMPFRVRIIEGGKETANIPNMMAKWSKNKDRVEKLLESGYKIVQHADSNTYTIMKDFKRNSVKMKTLGYIGGGHFEPKYDFYIRQGIVDDMEGAKVLSGDLNLAAVPTQKQADEIAKIFEEARLKVKNSDPDARRFIDENLPFDYAEFVKKVKTGSINLDIPIVATAKGQRSSDVVNYRNLWGDNFHDYESSTRNLLLDTDPKYANQRSDNLLDVYTADKGTVFKQEWESILDPMDALSSSSRNMINVRMMEDYAIKSTNDWIQEFGHLLNVDHNMLKSNPRYYLNNPTYRSTVGIDKAEGARLSILSLFDQVDNLDSGRNVVRDKIMSKAFDVGGEKLRSIVDDNWMTARDAQTLIRRTTSNLKLGFFNMKQLFLQSSAVAATVAISPRAGLKGMYAYAPTRFALLSDNDDVIRGLANKFGNTMGWKKDEWIEMVRAFKQSGFANVGGDTAFLDQMSTKSPGQKVLGGLRESPIGKIASNHTVFFQEGELAARTVAFSSAYSEWKAANPGRKLDRFAESAILNRAKTFTQNMTRESNSQWQKGWASVATQFFGYNMRVMEQLWDGGLIGNGKKLSAKEKVRFMAAMGILYGAGTTVSAPVPFVPAKDVVRDWLGEAGVDLDDYPVADAVMDGLIAKAVESMTGAEMDFSVYGPTGLPTIYDLMNEDKTWAETLMGAGPGVLGDVATSFPNLAYAYGFGENANVTANDLLAVLRNVSTIDNISKTYIALNTGKYLSRKGTYLTDVTQTEAILQSILGVAPERIAETFSTNAALKKFKEARKSGLKQYEEYHRNAIRALETGDEDSYRIYAKRRDAVRVGYDLSPTEVNQINRRYFNESSVSESIDENLKKWNRKYKLYLSNGE